jgi:hypothetical protein
MTAARLDGNRHMRRVFPLSRWKLPRWALRATTAVCLRLASVTLALARGMARTGLAGPSTTNRALRLSTRLTQVSLRAWRRASSRTRSLRAPDR